jgi:hypothetical protein
MRGPASVSACAQVRVSKPDGVPRKHVKILSEQLTIGPCDIDPKKHVELRRAWKHFLPQPLGGVEPGRWRYVRHPHVTVATAGTSFESAQLAFKPRDLAEEHVDLAAIRFEAPSEVPRPLVVTAPASGRTNLGWRWSEL